ncbi:MAG: thermonuclease family protein [Candidatus Levybacteria bacterium]|nr:thermonuclease family protein [Candidatus Levybacteria bacterium]
MSRKKLSSLLFTVAVVVIFTYLNEGSLASLQKNIFPNALIPTLSPKVSEKNTVLSASDSSHLTGTVKVIKIVDGDTIKIEGGQKVRYIGIETPETKHPTKGVQCFGKEASAKNKELVEGKEVTLEKDVSETDRYGRLLRFVYINGVFVNDYLVREGYAHASTYPPDVKLSEQFKQAEQEARENNRGLWNDCQ